MKVLEDEKCTSDSSLHSDYPAAAGPLREQRMNSDGRGCEGQRSLLSFVLFSLHHSFQQTLCEAVQMFCPNSEHSCFDVHVCV